MEKPKPSRRGLLGAILGAGAAAVAGPEIVKNVIRGAESAGPSPAAVQMIQQGLPILDVLRKIVDPYERVGLDLVSDKVFRVTKRNRRWVKAGEYEDLPPEVTHGHVDHVIYGRDHVEAMLADPIGKPIELARILGEKYWSWSGPGKHILAAAKVLRVDGREAEARLIEHALRADAIREAVQERVSELRNARTYPPRIWKMENEVRNLESGYVPLSELPKKLLERARLDRKLARAMESCAPPRVRNESWWDEYYRSYRQVRARILNHEKWVEHKWLRDIQNQRRAIARWKLTYRERRRPYFERELAERRRIKGVVLDALVEHRLAGRESLGIGSSTLRESSVGRDLEVEVCLGVLNRLTVLESVPLEALEKPPEISPVDVVLTSVGNYFVKRFGTWRDPVRRRREVDLETREVS